MADWGFGNAFLEATGAAQKQDITAARAPVELQHLQSLASLQTAQAAEANQRVTANTNIAKALSNTSLAEGSPSDQMMQLANVAARGGAGNMAKDYLLRAVQMKTQETRQAAADATAARVNSNVRLQQANLFNQLHSGAQSQEDWDTANMIFSSQTGEPVPPEMRTYSPEMASRLLDSSLKLKDKIRLQQQQDDLESKRASRASQVQYRALNYSLRQAAEERRKEAQAAKEKAAGKDVGSPSSNEVSQAGSMLSSDPTLTLEDSADRTNAAIDVASRARALRKSNPGLNQAEALQRALVELKTSGALVQTPKRWGGAKTTYSTAGLSSTAPLELSAKPDPGQLIKGRYYKGPGGVFQWSGSKAVPVSVQPTRTPAASASPDDEDEEE